MSCRAKPQWQPRCTTRLILDKHPPLASKMMYVIPLRKIIVNFFSLGLGAVKTILDRFLHRRDRSDENEELNAYGDLANKSSRGTGMIRVQIHGWPYQSHGKFALMHPERKPNPKSKRIPRYQPSVYVKTGDRASMKAS